MFCDILFFFLSLNVNVMEISKPIEITEIVSHSRGYKLSTIMPERDNNPIDSSIVWITYTSKEIVIYAKNFQEGISANSRRRDAIGMKKGQEDNLAILLAPYGKGKDIYYIAVNPLGTIFDAMITTSGETEWDGDISTITEKTPYGWTALIRIPFSSISYDETTWGIQILRVIAKKAELQELFPTSSMNYLQDLAEMQIDFTRVKRTKAVNFYVVPSLRYTIKDTFPGKITYGSTFRLKEGTKALLDFVYKPDFSELDVDLFKMDLRRLPINYPEKRPFFTEGSNFLTMPFPLLRTRNFEYPKYGMKFYTASEKNSFITYFISDDSLKNVGIIRNTYSVFNTTNIGFYLFSSQFGYNILSGDFSHYFENLKTSIYFQGAKRLDNDRNVYYAFIEKNEQPGFSFGLSFLSVDSSIISPFNRVLIDFENVHQGDLYFNYRLTRKGFTIMPSLYYTLIKDKKSSDEIYKNTSFNLYSQLTVLPVALALNIGITDNNMGYLNGLGFSNTNSFVYSISPAYFSSSWNRGMISYNFGDYLDGSLRQILADFRFSLFNRLNLGFSLNSTNSNYDSLTVIENYGEITLYKALFLKPYISYSIDRMNKKENNPTKTISFNSVLAFEPSYLTGFYICYFKDYDVTDGYIPLDNRLIFKLKVKLGK